jgi:drug/metabolite transporter (DMT)-like permease
MEAGLVETGTVVGIWFVLNIAMSNILKWTFVYGALHLEDGTTRKYQFPCFISVLHMVASWLMCGIYLRFVKGWPDKTLAFKDQLRMVWPLGLCFSLSIASNNLSLLYIYPSLNQMLASMGPLITVGLAVVLTGTRYNHYTWLSMMGISGGLVLCARFDSDLNAIGVMFAVSATVLRGVKSIVQQKLLTEKVDSMLLLFYMAPCAGLSMLVASAISEGTAPLTIFVEGHPTGVMPCIALLVLGSCNACLLNLANFLVTKYTSAVTLQVLGNVKSCLNIGVSLLIFQNKFQATQGVGVAVCLLGTWVYNNRGGKLESAKPMFPVFDACDERPLGKVLPYGVASAAIGNQTEAPGESDDLESLDEDDELLNPRSLQPEILLQTQHQLGCGPGKKGSGIPADVKAQMA